MDAIDLVLVVQVGSGRQPRHAYESDYLPLPDARARKNARAETAQVRVTRHEASAVPDLDQVSVAAAPAPVGDDPVRGRHDANAGVGGVVHAVVGAPPPQHGVEAGTLHA